MRYLTIILIIALIAVSISACVNQGEESGGTQGDTYGPGQSAQDPQGSNATSAMDEITSEGGTGQGSTATAGQNSSSAHPTSGDGQQPTARQAVTIVIPPGFTFIKIAQRLEANGVCTAKDFYDAAQSYQVNSFTVPNNPDRCFKMEGYLFPDTYSFYVDDDPVRVLREMLNNYRNRTGAPEEKILILASVIEREARSETHMKMVSSVFHNRLRDGERLEADSTRDYANSIIEYARVHKLDADPQRFAFLYNTYRNDLKGKLPAGPICSPGLRAIEAAKNPAQSTYKFFYFGIDNDNHYSNTFEEHEAKMKEIPVQY